MRKITLFIFLIPILLNAQETNTITREVANPKGKLTYNVRSKEVYNVLASNKKIKQGLYQRYILPSNVLVEEGYYKNNLQDSLWTLYHRYGKRIATGNYSNGIRTGIWNFYNPSGNKLEQSYDYSTGKLISYRIDEYDINRKFKVYTDSATFTTIPERPPLYIGGSTALRLLLEANTDFSQFRVDGFVIVTYEIDIDGKTSNFRVLKSLNYLCDEEALRLAKLLADNWIPCVYNGKFVKCQNEFTMTFRAPKIVNVSAEQ